MGIFNKKKRIELPKFPDIPKFEESVPNYEPTLFKIKQEIESPHFEEAGMFEQKPVNIPERKMVSFEKHIVNRPPVEAGKPIFVKIDQYKEALETLEEIKRKIKDAETIYNDIEKMRGERDRKLDEWKANLYKIKEKLMLVDKRLFEL